MDKQYNYKESQVKVRELWEHELTYARENNPGKLFSIDTPPPTISGSLHIGHIFSYTQTDIIARYKRMQGFSVFYPFGFDDNGLATERFVEKKRGISAHIVGRSEFIKLCLEETALAQKQFKELWQCIGLSVDWRLCYSTISDPVRKISQESFIRLFQKGYIYRQEEPALYCTTCRTSVAQAELDSAEISSTFNDIVFSCQNGKELIIGTTRPELLYSCVALLYHPEDGRYKQLNKMYATVPIFGHQVPILSDETVEIEKGTGLVMVCTFGDSTDIAWYKKFKFPFRESIGLNGKFVKETVILSDLNVAKAREKIIETLKEKGLLKNQRPITHSVNTHERCKKEIEYTVLKQWFLNILDHKKTFLDLANQINWYPEFMKARYTNWVENINWNWCLSRQRFYGIPFPAWHCTNCKQILLADIKQLPIDPKEMPHPNNCTSCNSSNIVPDTDVMDTWNSSSLTPYICYSLFNPNAQSIFENNQAKNFIPMSMRPQAHDIIRTWAFYTIVKSWMHNQTVPWENIVISGHVLSDLKEKISKSKDNSALLPENLLSRYSADVIRFWTASGTLGNDVAFSENQLKIGQKLVTKLWNAFIFISQHFPKTISSKNKIEKLSTINEWILHKTSLCYLAYAQNLNEKHEFSLALDQVEKFFWHDFCDNYLELIKDQLFNPEHYASEEIEATQWTLYSIGLRILQLYAPYLPYVTETIYCSLYKQHEKISSIHQTKFDNIQKIYNFPDSAHKMNIIIDLVGQIRKLKSENQLSLKTELKNVTISGVDELTKAIIIEQEKLLKGIIHAQNIRYSIEPIEIIELQKHEQHIDAMIKL